jgi:hypothetical protein
LGMVNLAPIKKCDLGDCFFSHMIEIV